VYHIASALHCWVPGADKVAPEERGLGFGGAASARAVLGLPHRPLASVIPDLR